MASSSLTIIGIFPELLGVGGVQESGRQTVRALDEIARKRGWDVQIFTLNDIFGEHCLPSPDHNICFRGFSRKKIAFLVHMIRHRLFSKRDGMRVVVAGHPNLAFPAWMMKIFSRSVKIIVMAHGVEVWTRLHWLKWNAILRADLVLGPSGDTVEKLIGIQAIAPGKVRKLAWPLSSMFLSIAEQPALLALPRAFPKGRVVLTVGRWSAAERYKGLDELLKATAMLRGTFPSLHLVVVGQGDDLPRLRKLAVDCCLADSVHFLGNISRDELAACYAHAEVFAMPSTGEGFGLVFLEAMAFAKPVIATACGGTTDLVRNGINGLLVPPGDTQKLTEAIGSLLTDDMFRIDLGRHGAELVRKKFRFEDFTFELDRMLGELRDSYLITVEQKDA
ncbi:MAG: glycosyltransferase family 4 protein [Terriglobales bacterium]|jgi:glycosyltransferase involved in cell wall biosynthesis